MHMSMYCLTVRRFFHMFNVCPFEKVKVVILGQDPYPTPGQYYGVCFSVPEGTLFQHR